MKWAVVALVPALVIFTARSLLRMLGQGDDLGVLTSLSGIVAIFGMLAIAYYNRDTSYKVRSFTALFLSIAGHALIVVWLAPVGGAMIYFAIGMAASTVVSHARVPAGLAAAGALIRLFDQVKGDAVVVFGIIWLLFMLYTHLEEPTPEEVANKLASFQAPDSEE